VITITLDWLAVTFKEFTRETQDFIRAYCSRPTTQAINARNGYTDCQRDYNGVELLWNPDYSSMGQHAVFSGSALRNLFASNELDGQTLLRACINAGGSISRLDLAKDLTEQAVDYEAVYQSLEQGLGGGNSRKVSKVQSNNGGFTVYVGSRQSERFLRLYNKAAEQQLPGVLWSRLEIEAKGMVARATATSLAQSGNWAGVFDGIMSGMVGDAKSVHLENFISRGNVPIGLPKLEKSTDREKWIESQVISAVAKHYIEHRDSAAVKRLIDTLLLIAQQQ